MTWSTLAEFVHGKRPLYSAIDGIVHTVWASKGHRMKLYAKAAAQGVLHESAAQAEVAAEKQRQAQQARS